MDALAAKVGDRPGRAPPAQLHPGAEQFPYTAVTGPGLRLRRLRRRARRRRSSWSATTVARAEQARRRAAGETKHLGIGISSYFEMCGLAPTRVLASLNYAAGGWEAATVRVLPTDKVQVVTGTTPHGQGHETSWSMIVADKLGVDPDDVDVLHSDTAISPLGLDTYGSRSLAVGGIAIAMACDKVIDKATHDRRPPAGGAPRTTSSSPAARSRVKGSPDKAMPLAGDRLRGVHRARPPRRHRAEPRGAASPTTRRTSRGRSAPTSAWSRSTTETGEVDVLQYVAVDDCGNQINPLIVDGQVHGGVIQGIAQALFEEAVYDDDGNLQTSTLADYLVPAAADVPRSRSATPSRRARPTRSASRASARPARSVPPRRSSTPSSTRCPISASRDVAMPAIARRDVWAAIQAASRQADAGGAT